MSEDIRLRRKKNQSTTQISNEFIDNYMTSANGEFVKIYLYLLRCMNADMDNLSISSIADHFDDTEKDVRRALQYWEKMKLLHLEYDAKNKLSSIEFLDIPELNTATSSKTAAATGAVPQQKELVAAKVPAKKPAVINNSDIKELLFITEKYLGKTLSPVEMDKILYMYNQLAFSSELIEYLVEYCVSSGYNNMGAIEKIALYWHESGITTVAEAQKAAQAHSQLFTSVAKAFGISGRTLTESENQYINKWSKEYNLSIEIIIEACNRTIEYAHQPSFKYADSIMESWFKNGVTTMADIEKLDASHKEATQVSNAKPARSSLKQLIPSNNKFNNFNQRNYDYDSIEKKLLGNPGTQ